MTWPFGGVAGSIKNGRFKNNGISTREKGLPLVDAFIKESEVSTLSEFFDPVVDKDVPIFIDFKIG